MEHLFKLKKDGKTVGYEKHALIKSVKIGDFIGIIHSPHGKWAELGCYSIIVRPEKFIIHDEKYPFVTKDKNGEDVFADDKVDSMGNCCLVMWHKVMFQWCLWHIEGDYYFGSLESKQVIELIEEEQ